MDPELHNLVQQLKTQKCPESVHRKVRFEMILEPRCKWFGISVLSFAGLAVCLFATWIFLHRDPGSITKKSTTAVVTEPDGSTSPTQSSGLNDAVLALTLTGNLLIDAGIQAESQFLSTSSEATAHNYLKIRSLIAPVQ